MERQKVYKREPDMLEQLEKARQRQVSVMERFALAQIRIAQVEARLESFYERRNALYADQNQATTLPDRAFLPASGELELLPGFAHAQIEDEPTERLTPLYRQSSPEDPSAAPIVLGTQITQEQI
jgi:hypothetical protein